MVKNSISEYAAFLRGINVGAHKKVPMAKLRAAFESLGFIEVRTLLNSGNVIFQTPPEPPERLNRRIETELASTFGFEIKVITRTMASLRRMVEADPFQGVEVTPDTRLYVTFLAGKSSGKLTLPWESPGKELRILALRDGALFSVVTLTGKKGTVDAMSLNEKTYGREMTTRNWNTILRVVRSGGG